MTLEELIRILEAADPKLYIQNAFDHPHSYRGFYEELSFAPVLGRTVGEMLKTARSAVGKTYGGWKGGNYTMSLKTEVHRAAEGCCEEDEDNGGFNPLLAEIALEVLARGRTS